MRQVAPELAQWLSQFNSQLEELIKAGYERTPLTARNGLATLTATFVTTKPEVSQIIDDTLSVQQTYSMHGQTTTPADSIPVRIYRPAADHPMPVMLYLHGGGHMAGNIEVYDPICRKIADKTQHIVVSIDYRLAPEHPYPAGLTDAYCTAEHLWGLLEKHTIKTTRHLTIAGDSGGGAMAATITQIATEQKAFSINRQVLIYPSLDYTMSQTSLEENGHGYLLTRETVAWYFDHYFKHQENREHASPLWLPIHSNYPSTLLLTAEFCPLRDEGFAFVEKLKHAHVPCAHVHFEDMIHAFMNMEDLTPKACEKLYSSIADFVVKGTS